MKIFWLPLRYLDAAVPAAGGGTEKPEEALLNKMRQVVKTEMNKRGFKDEADEIATVEMILNKRFGELNAEQTTALIENNKLLTRQVRGIASAFEKLKANPVGQVVKFDALRSFLAEKMTEIEGIYNDRKKPADGGKQLTFNVRAAAVMTTVNTTDETTNAIPAELIESMTLDSFVEKRYGVQYLQEIANRVTVSEIEQYTTWLEEGSEQGAFAIVAEGATKPLVSYALVRNVAKAKKIAGKYVVTEEFTKFRKNAYNIIQRLIRNKLMRDYSALLTADIQTASAGYTGTTLDGTINDPNDYDAIGAVAAQIETLNFNPNILIVHPQDKWRIRLAKDKNDQYLFPVVTENGITTMVGLRVFTSTYQTLGSFTLGESGLFNIEEEAVTVRIGYGITVTGSAPVTAVVGDFDNNQLRVIVEAYFKDWLATPHIGSFVTASFATVKAALAAA